MSAELTGAEAALYGGLGGGLVGGLLALHGVVIERVMRLIGFLRFDPSRWQTTYHRRIEGWGLGGVDDPKDATEMEYRVAIDLFSGKEVPTGLRNVRVEMILGDGRPIESPVEALVAVAPSPTSQSLYEQLDVLNVPPRQFVHKELRGSFGEEETVAYKDGRWRRIDFVADRPKRPFLGILGSKTYRKTIKTKAG